MLTVHQGLSNNCTWPGWGRHSWYLIKCKADKYCILVKVGKQNGNKDKKKRIGGLAKHRDSVRASHPADPGSSLSFPKVFSEITWNYYWKNSFDIAELIDGPA